MKTIKNRLTLLTLAALGIASVAGILPFKTLGSAPPALAPQIELDKEVAHARMRELQGNIEKLLIQYGQSHSQYVRAQIDAAQQEFDSISNQLGGDRPVATASDQPQAKTLGLPPPVAAAPVGCPTTTTTFSASPNIRIPTTGTSGTRTTTIAVSGLATSIWDVNAITNLTHTASADLDITLMSPAGTIVTLTTDNGGSLDNVFNGTTWDDQANPSGQVPYSSNNGLASDHAYVNNTTATPLVPEEALGAFIGENPNGTWTLTIHDDALADIGNLASWSLIITTLGANTFTTNSVFPSIDPNLPAVVSNTCLTGIVTSTVTVAGMGLHSGRVKLTFSISHFNPDDMDITLTSPQGTVATITTDNGNILAPNSFDGTTFDSRANLGGQVPYPNCLVLFPCNQGLTTDRVYAGAGPATLLVPEESLAAFNGENPNGVWTLKVVDDTCNLLIGVLRSWSLDITTATCCSITCPANISQGNSTGQCGANVTFNPSNNGFCATITCMPPSGAFFPKGTTTVNCGTSAGPACSFTVTVNDTQPPTITCPSNVTQSTAAGQCQATVNYAAPTVSDNCSNVGAPVCSPASGSVFQKGTMTVNCSVTDSAALTSNCSFTVTVNDTQPPTIACPANVTKPTAANLCSAVVTYSNATASDNCPNVGTPVCTPPSNSTFTKGTTTVNCTVSDASGNTASCAFTVTVTDSQAPTIVCPANVTKVTAKPCDTTAVVTFATPTVSDNCSGVTTSCTPASGSSFPVGTTTVTCKATDTSGNMTTCSFTTTVFDVRLQDDTNPNIVILFNTFTGDFRFCCGGTTYIGKGTIVKRACTATLSYNAPTVRVVAGVEAGGPNKGTASVQSPPGVLRCTITDRDITNNTSLCQ